MPRTRTMLCRCLAHWLVTLGGVATIIVALGATRLGLDHNTTWGTSRKALLLLGIGGLALAQGGGLLRVMRATGRHLQQAVASSPELSRKAVALAEAWRRMEKRLGVLHSLPGDRRARGVQAGLEPPPATERHSESAVPGSNLGRGRSLVWVVTLGLIVGIELIYVWFVSVGFWSDWPQTTTYFDRLGDAFLHGQTSLLEVPDSRLAEMANPYSFEDRHSIPILWDASYFQGKYYLYWGPAPAAVIALVKLVWHHVIGDHYVVFVSVSTIFLSSTLIILYLWRHRFSTVPAWLPLSAVVVAGLGNPMLWVLGRPANGEAAIVSGQAFLLVGLFVALPTLDTGHRWPWRMLLAGILWSLAIGSRLVLGGAIAVFTLALLVRLCGTDPEGKTHERIVPSAAALLLPLALGVLALGWYNFARFGTPFEFGLRYQLTGRDLNRDFHQVFAPLYLAPNLFNYLFRPVRALPVFPFIKSLWGIASLSPLPIRLPPLYWSEQVTGLVVSTPFASFGGFLLWWLLCEDAPSRGNVPQEGSISVVSRFPKDLRRTLATILAGAAMAFLPIGLFFFCSARYLMDASPLVTIVSGGGSWVAYQLSDRHTVRRRLVGLAILAAAVVSAAMGILLGVTSYDARFQNLNPVLFDQITRLLAW